MLATDPRSGSPKSDGGSPPANPADGGFAVGATTVTPATPQNDLEIVAPKVRGSPGCPTISPVLPDCVDSNSK